MDISKITPDNIVPKKKRVIVKPHHQVRETSSGLILPEQENVATPTVGVVIAAGEESEHTMGQAVFFRRYTVDEIKFSTSDGEAIVYMLEDDDIIAIAKE